MRIRALNACVTTAKTSNYEGLYYIDNWVMFLKIKMEVLFPIRWNMPMMIGVLRKWQRNLNERVYEGI